MRQIILDTETTGLSAKEGHRIIEIGCIEMIDRQFTGEKFHHYINPQREIDIGAQEVHGITSQFLIDKPLFKDIVTEFIRFIAGAELIIHNAPFDMGFLDCEFKLAGLRPSKTRHYCQVFDTLTLARKKYPGQKNNLDALCKRYKIDNSNRQLHGALLDATILAQVYLAMTGGQTSLFAELEENSRSILAPAVAAVSTSQLPLIVIEADDVELEAHAARIEAIAKWSGVTPREAGWE